MTFRARLTVALAGVGLLPVLLLAVGVRREIHGRLRDLAAERVTVLAAVMRQSLEQQLGDVRRRVVAAADDLRRDDRLRPALVGAGQSDRRRLLDWAADAARRSGLVVLQLHDSTGRILSSAHFRNDFDRMAPRVPELLRRSADGAAVVTVRTASGELRVLAVAQTVRIGGAAFTLVGGTSAEVGDVAVWGGDGDIRALLAMADEPVAGTAAEVRGFASLIDPGDGAAGELRYLVVADPAPTALLLRSVDQWLLVAIAAVLMAALLTATGVARHVSRPLEALAAQTSRLELSQPGHPFDTGRDDEIGDLARRLDGMTSRLAASATLLRESERRMATGDLARQVNHDIKNGLIPVRNVIRHLSDVAARDPASLPSVFHERQDTLAAGIAYLESLAGKYAGLSPDAASGTCRPNQVIRESVDGLSTRGARPTLALAEHLPEVRADPVVLRRIIDNLVGNAMDAVEASEGVVTVRSEAAGEMVRLVVADSGPGMTREELHRAFQAFHTTKPDGTGLGLAVVRQLVSDLGGRLRVETAPGLGTTFHLELPRA